MNVDDIQVHRNDDGKADETLTDLVAHFVDPETEEIWDAHRVITIADDQAALLQGKLHDTSQFRMSKLLCRKVSYMSTTVVQAAL